jgi:hypothetical protein
MEHWAWWGRHSRGGGDVAAGGRGRFVGTSSGGLRTQVDNRCFGWVCERRTCSQYSTSKLVVLSSSVLKANEANSIMLNDRYVRHSFYADDQNQELDNQQPICSPMPPKISALLIVRRDALPLPCLVHLSTVS